MYSVQAWKMEAWANKYQWMRRPDDLIEQLFQLQIAIEPLNEIIILINEWSETQYELRV